MRQQTGSALIVVILIILLLLAAGVFFYFNGSKFFQKDTSPFPAPSASDGLLKEEYENPFNQESQYQNPFPESGSEYQNPFDSLQ